MAYFRFNEEVFHITRKRKQYILYIVILLLYITSLHENNLLHTILDTKLLSYTVNSVNFTGLQIRIEII